MSSDHVKRMRAEIVDLTLDDSDEEKPSMIFALSLRLQCSSTIASGDLLIVERSQLIPNFNGDYGTSYKHYIITLADNQQKAEGLS